MRMYFLRHTQAEPLGVNGIVQDELRPLTRKGRKTAKQIGVACTLMELQFDRVLTSPLVRAKETFQELQLPYTLKPKITKTLSPSSNPKHLIEYLIDKHLDANELLLVGHAPLMAETVAILIGTTSERLSHRKGGMFALEFTDELHFGVCARLLWSLTAEQFQRIAQSRKK
ncbi:MAG: histidine phosphatase family protein [bacterium]|nr:histidine phosphatase family protein [bacterium]